MNDLLERWEGMALVLGAIGFTFWTLRWSKSRPLALENEETKETRGLTRLIGVGVLGLVVLIAGGEMFVRGAIGIAQSFNVDERIIGLTIVAFGTSVPELAASMVAAVKGHSALAIGNVVGSNIFNALFILGSAAVIRPISADLGAMTVDMSFLMALTLYVVVALWRSRLVTRLEGGLLVTSYLTFIGFLVAQIS